MADKEGFFDDAGVNVKLISSSSGNAALQAAIGGNGEIVASGMSNNVLAAAKGHPLNFFATMVSRLPNNIIISKSVAKKKGITLSSPLSKKIAALKGLTIGITEPGSVTDRCSNGCSNATGSIRSTTCRSSAWAATPLPRSAASNTAGSTP